MIKKYFELSKKEFNGLIILCFLLILLLLLPQIYSLFIKEEKYDYSEFDKEVKAFLASAKDVVPEQKFNGKKYSDRKSNPHYFKFNPNNLSETSWLQLGLSERQIKVIKNFEMKGGRFFRKEDLQKIYSISAKEYEHLEPYIDIPVTIKSSFKKKFDSGRYPASLKSKPVIVDINMADSAAIEGLKGIGAAFAKRIVKYRDRLGGFAAKEQLLEVYGMDTIRYRDFEQQILIDQSAILKTAINKAGFAELRRYPYLSNKQINAILQYKRQHGNYASAEDLKKVLILSDDVIVKILPYLSFN